jgi:hypothetical protein
MAAYAAMSHRKCRVVATSLASSVARVAELEVTSPSHLVAEVVASFSNVAHADRAQSGALRDGRRARDFPRSSIARRKRAFSRSRTILGTSGGFAGGGSGRFAGFETTRRKFLLPSPLGRKSSRKVGAVMRRRTLEASRESRPQLRSASYRDAG